MRLFENTCLFTGVLRNATKSKDYSDECEMCRWDKIDALRARQFPIS